MVGVPKSTGCFICRKRKIKCDESWPICVNCQKNNKSCPGPPARHTFRDLGPKLSKKSSSTSPGDASSKIDKSTDRLTQLNEKWSESGSVFQKFRICNKAGRKSASRSPQSPPNSNCSTPMATLRYPSPSQHEELARALVETLDTGGIGHRMSNFGSFIRGVPSRIGHNAALDAAVACLVNAHTSMIHNKCASEVANPVLYLRAVQTLQASLEDPLQGMSPTTLCASVLLGLVEALAGPRIGNQYLAHVGGAGRLMELQGPTNIHDSFAKEVLRFNRGGIIITAIYERRPCFLASPEWCDLAFDKTGLSFDDCLYTDILHRMADFSSLLRELTDLEQDAAASNCSTACSYEQNIDPRLEEEYPSPYSLDIDPDLLTNPLAFLAHPYELAPNNFYSASRTTLVNKVHALRSALHSLSIPLTANLSSGTAALELPSIDSTSPIATSFHFTNWRGTVAYNCFWSLLILTNKLLLKLLPQFDPLAYILEAECRATAYEICKTWEDAWASRPIGAFHVGLSFVVAYEFCTGEVKEWILRGLNGLLEYQGVETFRWNEDIVRSMSEKLAGAGPDMEFTNAARQNR